LDSDGLSVNAPVPLYRDCHAVVCSFDPPALVQIAK